MHGPDIIQSKNKNVMKIVHNESITILAPAQKCWDTLGNDFGQISHWASSIGSSSAVKAMDGATSGRTCMTPYGEITEEVTSWDDTSHAYEYKMTGLPPMFKRGSNRWSIEELSASSCKVTMQTFIEMKAIPGALLGWMLKPRMIKNLTEMLEELQYYVEKDGLHPRKIKAKKKSA